MQTAKLFRNGNSQAVRLPKEFAFEGQDEVYVNRLGRAVILVPKDKPWRLLEESLGMFTTDFMEDREQPATTQDREGL